jgi:hypothetical protein
LALETAAPDDFKHGKAPDLTNACGVSQGDE